MIKAAPQGVLGEQMELDTMVVPVVLQGLFQFLVEVVVVVQQQY
jgi:hypothetical protein